MDHHADGGTAMITTAVDKAAAFGSIAFGSDIIMFRRSTDGMRKLGDVFLAQ